MSEKVKRRFYKHEEFWMVIGGLVLVFVVIRLTTPSEVEKVKTRTAEVKKEIKRCKTISPAECRLRVDTTEYLSWWEALGMLGGGAVSFVLLMIVLSWIINFFRRRKERHDH